MEMIKLDLMDPKKFNTQSYKEKSYIDEEKRVLIPKYILEKRIIQNKINEGRSLCGVE